MTTGTIFLIVILLTPVDRIPGVMGVAGGTIEEDGEGHPIIKLIFANN